MTENETLEVFNKWHQEIVKSIDIYIDKVVREGNPPEEAIKIALIALLRSIANYLENDTDLKSDSVGWFPMEFPMRMELSTDQCVWDFMLTLTLKNRFGIEEENEDG